MKSAVDESNHVEEVFAEQVKLLYANSPVALFATLANGAILVLVQRTHIAPSVLIYWYCSLVLVTTLRAITAQQFARTNPNFSSMHRWNTIFLLGTACAGAVWGATAIFLFPADSMAHQLFVAFVLAGMSAGAMSVLSARLEACLAFLLPTLLPLVLHYLGHGNYLEIGMGIMTLLFFAGMLFSAWTFHRTILASLNLRFDNRELAAEVAQRRTAEEQIFMEKDRLQTTLSAMGEGVAMADANGRIEYLNPAAEALCGHPFHEALNRPANEVFEILDFEEEQSTGTAMEESIRTTSKITRQGILYCKTVRHIIEEVATPLYDRHSKVVGAVAVIRDITEAQKMTERLAYAADHDALTGLPNRILLIDRTRQAIARAQRKHESFALLFMDLDRFKAVNDALGHAAGDALLVNVAERLAECVREEDTIARLGGDEFVVLLNGPTQASDAISVANKIRKSVGKPYQLENRSASVTASIGFSLYPANGEDVETLLGHADHAMYRAKQHGRNQVYM